MIRADSPKDRVERKIRNGESIIQGEVVNEPVEIDISHINKVLSFLKCSISIINIRNCTLENGIEIEKSTLNEINFYNSTIKNSNKSKVKKSTSIHDSEIYTIKIIKSWIIGSIDLGNTTDKGFNNIVIENSAFESKNVKIFSSLIKGMVVNSNKFNGSFVLENNKFTREVDVNKNECHNLIINDNIFDHNINNSNNHISSSFFLSKNLFKGVFNSKNLDVSNELRIDENDFQNHSRIRFNKRDSGAYPDLFLYFNNNKTSKLIEISGSDYNEGPFNPIIKKLRFFFTSTSTGNFRFRNFNSEELMIEGQNFSNITFENILTDILNLNDIDNENSIKLVNFSSIGKRKSIIFVINSYIKGMKFIKFDFSSYDTINTNGSYLQEIVTSRVKWFEDSSLNPSFDEEFRVEENQEIYRQLKASCKHLGHIIDSLEFRRRELEYYRLKTNKRISWKEWIVLIGSLSNNHGTDWLKPFLLLLLMNFTVYTLLTFSSDIELHNTEIMLSFNGILNFIKYLFNDLSLFFELGYIFSYDDILKSYNYKASFISHFLLIFHKVLYLFFVYQIIFAFRKYRFQ